MVMINDVEVREGLYYNKEHSWLKIEDGKVKIGISDHGKPYHLKRFYHGQ